MRVRPEDASICTLSEVMRLFAIEILLCLCAEHNKLTANFYVFLLVIIWSEGCGSTRAAQDENVQTVPITNPARSRATFDINRLIRQGVTLH